MIIRTVMEVDVGNRKEYVDSKVYEAIRYKAYVQGRTSAIEEFRNELRDSLFDDGHFLSQTVSEHDIDEIAERLKEKTNE